MSSKVPGSNVFGAIVVLLLVGGMVYAVKQSGPAAPAQGGADQSVVPDGVAPAPVATLDEPTTTVPETPSTTQPTLLFMREVGNGHQVIRRLAAGNETVLFTDADLDLDLQAILGVSNEKAVALFLAADGHTELRTITLDGSGQTTTLNGSFGGASGASFSAAAKQVAFAVFDNAERSFGFSLVREGLDGTGREVVDSDAYGISLPAWSHNGKQLAYIQGQATPDAGQSLRVATLGNPAETIHTFATNLIITSLAWLDTNSLVYVAEPLGNNTQNEAKTYAFDLQSKQARELVDFPGKDRSLVVSDTTGWLAAVVGDVRTGETQSAGMLTILELATGKQQTLSTANSVGTWISE